jgi:transformer-2 protein
MSDSDSSSSRDKSRSRSRRKSPPPRSASKRSKSESKSKSRSNSRDRYSRSRSRSHRRRNSKSRSRSYDRKRSDKYDRSTGSKRGSRRDRSSSPFSNRRRHQGDRENPRQSRCLGVFGLSLYTQERELRDLFEKFGPVEDLQIVYDHQTGRSRGFGFIYMKNHDDAAEAKEVLPGTELDGHKIRVDYSVTNRAHTPTPGVYLGRASTSSYRRSNNSPPPRSSRRSDYGKRRSPSYSRSYSRSPRRY